MPYVEVVDKYGYRWCVNESCAVIQKLIKDEETHLFNEVFKEQVDYQPSPTVAESINNTLTHIIKNQSDIATLDYRLSIDVNGPEGGLKVINCYQFQKSNYFCFLDFRNMTEDKVYCFMDSSYSFETKYHCHKGMVFNASLSPYKLWVPLSLNLENISSVPPVLDPLIRPRTRCQNLII